jgi:hypothetical protein
MEPLVWTCHSCGTTREAAPGDRPPSCGCPVEIWALGDADGNPTAVFTLVHAYGGGWTTLGAERKIAWIPRTVRPHLS